jgi:LysR family transcriptional regulator, putative pyruvate carboxylase regulator
MPALLSRFEQRYPEARATLVVGDSAEVVGWLLDYRVPVGVIGETVMAESLSRVPIGSDDLCLVARAGDRLCRVKQIEAKHLEGYTLLMREPGSSTRAGAESLLGELIKACGRIVEVRHTEAIKQMVAAGLGAAVLSSWATRLEEKAGLLQPVRDGRFRHERRFYLAQRQDRELTGVAKALWHFVIHGKKKGP